MKSRGLSDFPVDLNAYYFYSLRRVSYGVLPWTQRLCVVGMEDFRQRFIHVNVGLVLRLTLLLVMLVDLFSPRLATVISPGP